MRRSRRRRADETIGSYFASYMASITLIVGFRAGNGRIQRAKWDPETTLSYASVMGIRKDIHLVKDDYQWLGSMFYFGPHRHIDEPYHVLIKTRIPGMGVSNKPTATITTSSKILFLLHHHVGSRTLLYGSLQELRRSCCCPILFGCL